MVLPFLVFFAAACGGNKTFEFPKQLEGGYRLNATHSPNPQEWEGVYIGPNDAPVLVHVEQTANAFEKVQQWKPVEGKLPFYKGNYFGVAESTAIDRGALNAFVAALERELP
jgi:hypothetical protein